MLTWTESYVKTQRLAKTSNADDVIQLKQDLNTGYHLFNAKLSRYFSRKQQFTNIISGQSIYQTPVDSVRILGMTVSTTSSGTYSPPIKEIVSEFEWRQIKTSYTSSNWIAYYFVLGNDEIEVWPTPSANVTNGMRFYYQPQDHDLSIDDVTSASTGFTVTATNGSITITATGAAFNADMATLWFQVTGQTDNTWYQIIAATTTTLTLKSNYVGTTGSTLAWRVGQAWIIPQEYTDAPMHYALGNFFSSQGNETRAQYHLGSDEDGKRGMFYQMVQNCKQDYSSSSVGNVITDEQEYISPWYLTPVPGA